jgi:hypothetical protein
MNTEQELKDLKQKYNLLVQTVHDMHELILEMRYENQQLIKTIEEIEND